MKHLGEYSLAEYFGNIDVYLFDQLQKGRFTPDMRVLDAGCGKGRNLIYMLRSAYRVFGVDRDYAAIDHIRELANGVAPHPPTGNFQVGDISSLAFNGDVFDVVICNAVLHFAKSESEFELMCGELMRVLRPGGYLFARLASDIGIENRVVPLGNRRFTLPDGSDRFLVDERLLLEMTHQLGGALYEPIKTVNVQGQRCMTTWCVQKN